MWLFVMVTLLVAVVFTAACARAVGTLLTRPRRITPPEPGSAPLAACGHRGEPVPVEVEFIPGTPETVAWLCPDCREEVPAPPPTLDLRRFDDPPDPEEIARRFATEINASRAIVLPEGFTYVRLDDRRRACEHESESIEELRTHQSSVPIRTVCTDCGEIQPEPLRFDPPEHDYAKR